MATTYLAHPVLAILYWTFVVAVLLIACQTVTEGASGISEQTKSGPVFLHKGIGIIDSSNKIVKPAVFGFLCKQLKLRERSCARAENLRHALRKKNNLFDFGCSSKWNLVEQRCLIISHPVWVISETFTREEGLPWDPTGNVECCSLARVLNTKKIFIHGREFIIGSGPEDRLSKFNFYPRALIKPKLLNALPESVCGGISSAGRGLRRIFCGAVHPDGIKRIG